VLIKAEADGVVEYVDSKQIIVRYDMTDEDKFVSFDPEVVTYTPSEIFQNQPGNYSRSQTNGC
jgi:DNA-directed RNA polymerase subunit beta